MIKSIIASSPPPPTWYAAATDKDKSRLQSVIHSGDWLKFATSLRSVLSQDPEAGRLWLTLLTLDTLVSRHSIKTKTSCHKNCLFFSKQVLTIWSQQWDSKVAVWQCWNFCTSCTNKHLMFSFFCLYLYFFIFMLLLYCYAQVHEDMYM